MWFNKLIILGFIFLLVSGCFKNEEQEWQEASKLNTTAGYVEFMENFPGSKFSGEARNHLKDYFNELHKNAIDSINNKDEKSLSLYNKILRLDPDDALALNNKAFIVVSEFTNGRPVEQNVFSERDRKIIEEGISLLKQAKEHTGDTMISPETLMLAFVFKVGDNLELAEIRAGKLPEINKETIPVERLVNINLTKLVKLLEKQK